jgi:branched-chain amino acid transport system ATP-binding protein
MFYGSKFRKNEQRIRKYAIHILELFHISDLQNQIAGDLSYGTQRTVEITRAMASKPKLILLDEPVTGMNSEESISLSENIKDIKKKFKVTILLVEHDMSFVMGLCERIIVVNYGVKIAEGEPEKIRNDQAVIEAYLGRQKC